MGIIHDDRKIRHTIVNMFKAKLLLKIIQFVSVFILGALTVSSASGKTWRNYQDEYKKIISGFSGSEVKPVATGVKILSVPQLKIQDRCTTCHIAMGEFRLIDNKNPLKPHPADYLKQHKPEAFGCTPCHGGDGSALNTVKAHGGAFRKGANVQISCAKCHWEKLSQGAPDISKGETLLKRNLCINCHYTRTLSHANDPWAAPRLRGIGGKTTEKWLWRWLNDPKKLILNASMPKYDIDKKYIDALIGYLFQSKGFPTDATVYPPGNIERGKAILRLSFCITCHPFNGTGGKEAPDLGKISNKVGEKWLIQMIAHTHDIQPDSPMPSYHFTPRQVSDMVAYMLDEFKDFDLADDDETLKLESRWPTSEERAGIGRRVYKELRCANCHGLLEENGWWRNIGPEFSEIGDKPIAGMNFGTSRIPRTRADYIFEKILNPRVYETPDNFTRMPKYDLAKENIRDLTLALLSYNRDKITVPNYRFPNEGQSHPIFSVNSGIEETYYPMANTAFYEPDGDFGRLVFQFRCFSCHSFNGRGYNITYDLSKEGSRVNPDWLNKYLKAPYSLRPILTIRMPVFNLTENEARILTSGIMRLLVDPEIDDRFASSLTPEMSVAGKTLFEQKGCDACHQVGLVGGYIGPSFTQGAFVGMKLKPGWVYKWLQKPQAMVSNVLMPDYSLSGRDNQAITAYLVSIRNNNGKVRP